MAVSHSVGTRLITGCDQDLDAAPDTVHLLEMGDKDVDVTNLMATRWAWFL
jgi:hypothetical protein